MAAPAARGTFHAAPDVKSKTGLLLNQVGVATKHTATCKQPECSAPAFAMGLCADHAKVEKETQRGLGIFSEADQEVRWHELLTKGEHFLKYSKSKKPHVVFVKLSPNLSLIRWGDQAKMEKSKSAGKSISTRSGLAVMKGRGSPIFATFPSSNPEAEFVSFSIMYEEGRKRSTLDLELPLGDELKKDSLRHVSLAWEKALQWAINKARQHGVTTAVAPAVNKQLPPADMPPLAELEARFEEFMVEKCLNPAVRDELRAYSDRAKWDMIVNDQKIAKDQKGKTEPEYWVHRISQLFMTKAELEDLRIILASAGRTWMAKFSGYIQDDLGEIGVEEAPTKNGILGLLNVMTRHEDVNEPEIVYEVLSCLKLLMNNDFGFKLGMMTSTFVSTLCNSLARATDACRSVALTILTTIAWDNDKGLAEIISCLEDASFPMFQDNGVGLRCLVSMIARLDGHGPGHRHSTEEFPDGKGGYASPVKKGKKNQADIGGVALWTTPKTETRSLEKTRHTAPQETTEATLRDTYAGLFELLVAAQENSGLETADATKAQQSVSVSDAGSENGGEVKPGGKGRAPPPPAGGSNISSEKILELKNLAAGIVVQLDLRERRQDHELAAVAERALMFVNTLINASNELESRVYLRQRLIELGLLDALVRVRSFVERAKGDAFETLGCARLELQCDLFDEEMGSDAQKSRWSDIDLANVDELFAYIKNGTRSRGLSSYLIALLQAVAVLPVDVLRGEMGWARVCDIVEYAVTPIPEPNDVLKNIKVEDSEYMVSDDGRRLRNRGYKELKQELDRLMAQDQKKLHDKVMVVLAQNAKLIDEVNTANLKLMQAEQTCKRLVEEASRKAMEDKEKAEVEERVNKKIDEGAPVVLATGLCAKCGGLVANGSGPPQVVSVLSAPSSEAESMGGPSAPEAPPAPDAPPAPPDAPEAPGAPEPPGVLGLEAPSFGSLGGRAGMLTAQLPPGIKPKEKIVPSKKMKNVHWTGLKVNKIPGTVFADCDDSKIQIPQERFESLFCQAERKVKIAEVEKKESKKITFVDGKRGYAVNIALGRLRLPHSTIRDYILAIDESWLDEERALTLLNCMPEPAELDVIAKYDGELSVLEPVDLFFLACLSIPNPKVRMECILLKLRFESMCDELDVGLEICIAAIDALSESNEVTRTMEIILALGNYLNAGTKNELCYGFDVTFLLKLENTKSQVDPNTNRSISLLEFIVDYCHHHDDDICRFWEFLLSVLQAAARVETAWLQGQTSKLKTGLSQISQELVRAEKDDHTVDRFHPVMSAFVSSAEPKVARLRRKLISLEQNVTKLARYLGCELEQEALFQLLVRFTSEWTEAQRKWEQDEARRVRENKRTEAKTEHLVVQTRSSATSVSGRNGDEQAGKVDAAMSVLRDSNKESIRSAITKRRTKSPREDGAPSRISRMRSKQGLERDVSFD